MTVEQRVPSFTTQTATDCPMQGVVAPPALLRRLREIGRAGAAPGAAGEALAEYWRFAGAAPLARRVEVMHVLGAEVAAGRASAHAYLVIALGEPDLELARGAARAYVGTWPASLERRTQAILDVIDWIVRGLPLNRTALCCALVDAGDDLALQQLAALRGRLSETDRAAVRVACAKAPGEAAAMLLEAWGDD